MKITVENPEKNVAVLEIELDSEEFEEAMNKSFNKNKGRFTVPGFRKGKAPRAIIQRFYGESVLYEDAVDLACPDAYQKAVDEKGIQPVSRPEIDIKQIGSGKNLIFTAKVALKPEVAIKDYLGVEVKKAEYKLADEDIDTEIERVRESNARITTIEDRPAEKGDIAVIDFEGFIDDKAFDGGKGENTELTIGSGQFIPGFEDQLIGKGTGEELDVSVTFPDDYHAGDIAGKPAVFKVKIREIRKKELPEADDEFAKDVSEFETLTEYRESIKKKLIEQNERREKSENENSVIRKVAELAEIDIPQIMIDNYVDTRLDEYKARFRYQGVDFEEYASKTGMDMDTLKKQIAKDAHRDIRTQLVMEAIGIKENIQASDEDLDEKLSEYASQSKRELSDIKDKITEDEIARIKDGIIFDKTLDLLVKNAVFSACDPTEENKEG